jgi:hypothetical protein
VPRKKQVEEKPKKHYLNADGTLNFDKIFKFQPKQQELLRYIVRNGKAYIQPAAPQNLSTGGIRSGKTCGWLMYFVMHYCLAFDNCNILVLRRNFKELENGAIADFKTFMPEELYTYDSTKHVATLYNGSRVVFGHCLAKGTLVTTQRGLVPIEEVTTEDSTLTRKGFRRVLWSGQTGTKAVVQLGPLSLTKEHKLLANGEWKSAEEITCQRDSKKTVHLLCHKPSYSKMLSTTGIQTQVEGLIACTTKDGETESKPISTSLFTRAYVGLFHRVSKFITRMKTLLTTPLMAATTNCFPLGSTEFTTPPMVLDAAEDRCSASRGKACAGNVANQLSPEQKRNDFVTLTVATPSEQITSEPVPVFDLQVEEEHEFFANGVLVHNCQNNKDRDIEQYLGQAYPAILVDECGQFSPDAWMMLFQRNIVNPACARDAAGNLPIPAIVGCTNPLGPHYEYYRTLFVDKRPWNPPEDARQDVDGTWWSIESGQWIKIYDPNMYAYQRSTVLDNQQLLDRDPGIIQRLESMPKAKRDKVLYGLDGVTEGQYFDCFDPTYHVINLREEPDAIIWQEYQPCWAGADWGMQHANATYLFTKALVKNAVGEDYNLKTVCFAEVVTTGGKTFDQLASIIKQKCVLPNGTQVKLKNIFFSHEKFNRSGAGIAGMAHTPADEYSRALRAVGLPPVTRATQDRISSASFMYNAFKKGELAILDNCKEIILAIPSLMRNPDLMDDVLKVDAKGDDAYDGFRYGLYGQLGAKNKPAADVYRDRVKELAKTDPLAAWFYQQKKNAEQENRTVCFRQPESPVWMNK